MGLQVCHVCSEATSKYKCPSCILQYCSLVCFKKHREIPCVKPVLSVEKPVLQEQNSEVSELLKERPIHVDQPAEVLQRVELESIVASSEIRDALKNEDLQRLISSIDNSVNASDDIDKAMGSDVFRIFADKVLSAANAAAIKQ
ncbi:hypothetical protein Droror1_Dr00011725 [Drosera rotundifolia]